MEINRPTNLSMIIKENPIVIDPAEYAPGGITADITLYKENDLSS